VILVVGMAGRQSRPACPWARSLAPSA